MSTINHHVVFEIKLSLRSLKEFNCEKLYSRNPNVFGQLDYYAKRVAG